MPARGRGRGARPVRTAASRGSRRSDPCRKDFIPARDRPPTTVDFCAYALGVVARLQELLGIDLPIVQAPMAGVQGSALAIAVSKAGGLGSLPCALLPPASIRDELARMTAQTVRPYNVNFFCHRAPAPSAERDAAWSAAVAPYCREL